MSLQSFLSTLFSDPDSAVAAPIPSPSATSSLRSTASKLAATAAPPLRSTRTPSAKQQAIAADFANLHKQPRNTALTATADTTWGLARDKIRRKYTHRALRLMLRLAKQIPPTRNQAETLAALQAKVDLLNQLLPVDWSLNLAQASTHPVNGTLSLTLIQHEVHINGGGAWRIQERFAPHRVLLEQPSIRGGKFRQP